MNIIESPDATISVTYSHIDARVLYEMCLFVEQDAVGYRAWTTSLPDVTAHGSAVDDAIANATANIRTAIENRLATGQAIPTRPTPLEIPAGAIARWVVVEVESDDDTPTADIFRSVLEKGGLDFWDDDSDGCYSIEDGSPP